jgi:hypothetical protein
MVSVPFQGRGFGGYSIWPRVRPQISIEVMRKLRSISISYFMAFSCSMPGLVGPPAWQD